MTTTHAEEILRAAAALARRNASGTFTRDDIRRQIGLKGSVWMSGYTAIFQGMRIDQPGGAPAVGGVFVGAFLRVAHGTYQLTAHGASTAKLR